MKVGIIVEGTYPYVTGGVSNWLQVLMENLPDIEFKVIHLSAKNEDKKFVYEIPRNVSEILDQPLFSEYSEKMKKGDPGIFVRRIRDLIDINWSNRVEETIWILKSSMGYDFYEVLHSEVFWKAIVDVYKRYFPNEGFTRYFWTIKGIFSPIINSFLFAVPPKCDIYHSITTGYAALKALSGKYHHNSRMIISEHGIYHREREREIITSKFIPECYKRPWIEIFKLTSAVSYREADLLTTLFRKNQLFQLELGASEEKMRIIPNGINVNKFNVEKKAHNGFVVGFVGRVTPIKDLKTAFKAIKIVSEDIKDLKFLVIGPYEEEPDYYEFCLEMRESLRLKDVIEFTGKVNVIDYYPIIDVLLLSSVSEGQPLVILEAMAAGIPVVATNVGACQEMIMGESKQCGFIVNPKDHTKIAESIKKLYSDREMAEQFSKNGKEIVRRKYTLEKMIKSYRRLYEDVLNL